jgi:hypothetical protein
MPDSMTARELLAKATVVFHLYIKRAIRHEQLRKVVPFTFRTVQKVQKRLQAFLQRAWMQFEFSPTRWLKNTRDHMKL